MTDEYDQITAFHYSAYRPSLHSMILEESLGKSEKFPLGLDVGCGTGQSSIALIDFCTKVIGVEPSREMLQKSITHPKIAYGHYNKRRFDFTDDYFDLVAFAGSLYYAKSQTLLNEVVRVAKNGSKVIVYDFELVLDVILEKLNVGSRANQEPQYDHETDFTGLNEESVEVVKKIKNHTSLEISIPNLSHLLLSSKDNYSLLSTVLGQENLYPKVAQKLQSLFSDESITIHAITYSTSYKIIK